MTAQTRTIAIVAAIILIAFGIYLSAPPLCRRVTHCQIV